VHLAPGEAGPDWQGQSPYLKTGTSLVKRRIT